jgi:hypothetical protein
MRQFYLLVMNPTMIGDKRRYILSYRKGVVVWQSLHNALRPTGSVIVFGCREAAVAELKRLDKLTDKRRYWLSIRAEQNVWWAV